MFSKRRYIIEKKEEKKEERFCFIVIQCIYFKVYFKLYFYNAERYTSNPDDYD